MTWRAPYFDLRSGLFIPCVVTRDPETGELTRGEGPNGFEKWEEADQAGRFLEARQAGRRGAEGFPELGELGE